MTTINETAYPRIKPNLSQAELDRVYTPSYEDLAYVRKHRRRKTDQLALMLLIKTTQRLLYAFDCHLLGNTEDSKDHFERFARLSKYAIKEDQGCMMLSKEIEMRNNQGETVTASYEVLDDKLVMCFPDGTNIMIL